MNIALVVLDTLRYDAFCEHFDWLAGAHFENAWAPSHWTVPVHGSLFAGKYPSELGVHVDNQALDCPEPVLAEQLAATGYTTRAFACNIILAKPFNFHRGFEEYTGTWKFRALNGDVFDWENFWNETHRNGPRSYLRAMYECVAGEYDTRSSLKQGARTALCGLSGEPFFEEDGSQKALEYIRATNVGEREFLYVNLMDAHMPYVPPVEYRTTDTDDSLRELTEFNGLVATARGGPDTDPELLRRAYRDSVRYLSDVYRRIFEELEADFDVVVTLSDHGELFGEHGAWQHAYGVYPELTHVPLVITGDGINDERHTETVSLLDVHRTLLDLANLDGESRGNGLLDLPAEGTRGNITVAPTSRACITEYLGPNPRNRTKVENNGHDSRRFDEELFGVAASTAYGYETTDGFRVSGKGEAAALEALLADRRAGIERRETGDRAEVSDAARRQLEHLGYA